MIHNNIYQFVIVDTPIIKHAAMCHSHTQYTQYYLQWHVINDTLS